MWIYKLNNININSENDLSGTYPTSLVKFMNSPLKLRMICLIENILVINN